MKTVHPLSAHYIKVKEKVIFFKKVVRLAQPFNETRCAREFKHYYNVLRQSIARFQDSSVLFIYSISLFIL